MHQMEKTNKILTYIGLGFESLSIIILGLVTYSLKVLNKMPFVNLDIYDIPQDELDIIEQTWEWVGNLTLVMLIIYAVFLAVNVFLFTKLIKGNWTEEQAKKVYLYQAIIGGVNLLSNQIVGICYLVCGVLGYQGFKEETDIREGI